MNRLSTTQVNENGRLVGESHPQATLSDEDVERMRELREHGASTAELSKMFNVSKPYVRAICRFSARNQIMVSERRKK